MMINKYLKYLNEGYLFSDKTISVNLDKFESGENNKLLIIGSSGSGKSTLAENLSKKYKCKWKSIDSMWYRIAKANFNDYDLRKKEVHKQVDIKVKEEVIELLKNNERWVIEGIDLLEIYNEQPQHKNLILNQPMIILGLSVIRAGIRAGIRNRKREDEGWLTIYWMIKFNIKLQSKLKLIKNDVTKLPNAVIKTYKVL